MNANHTKGPLVAQPGDGELDSRAKFPTPHNVLVFALGDCDTHPVADFSSNGTCRTVHEQEANAARYVLMDSVFDDLVAMLARVADAEFGFGGWPTEAEISAVLANARGAQPAEPLFYLQDTRTYVGNCPLWWAHGGRGYTTDVRQAHRYTLAEAQQQHECRDTDRPWPCADIDKLIRHTVDMQDMRRIPKVAARATPPIHPMDACRHGNRKTDCDHCKETL